jgi:hypothetical protein
MKLKQLSVGISLAVGTALAIATSPAQAANFFGNGTFSFTSNQTFNFNFLLSKGMWQSNFGVYNVTTGQSTVLFSEVAPGYDPTVGTKTNGDSGSKPFDWLGSCGVTIPTGKCTNSFDFLANNVYQFYLTGSTTQFSSTPGNTVFAYNGGAYVFSSSGPNYNATKPKILATLYAPAEGALIAMNDTHAIDADKNDFIVTATPTSVPEPASLLGLGLVAGGGFLASRRRKLATQPVKA